jgi:membrane-associated phospholipid phosphatase
MNWIEAILEADRALFLFIHKDGANSFFDGLLPLLRNPLCWIPVYVFLLYFSIKKYGRNGLLWCLAFILVFGLCDFTAASIIKPWVGRLRPCNDPSLLALGYIRELVHCGSGFSFPSAHSSNHFGLSFFIVFTLGRHFSWIKWPAILWAVLVVYAQVYVGVHYPIDILGGMVLGFIMAWMVQYVFLKYISFRPFEAKH